MKAADALHWYREAASGTLTLPIPDNPSERGRFDVSFFGSGQIIYPVPFIGPGAQPARIHRLSLRCRCPAGAKVLTPMRETRRNEQHSRGH